jgi:4-hydroxybenzoate polyprenyltransferase
VPALLVRLRGWTEAAHPFPLAAVLLLTTLIAVASSDDGPPDAGRLALVLVAMLLSQLAIGWTNDYVDRESDRGRLDKPVPAGRVDAGAMPLAVAGVLAGALLTGLALGPLPLLFLVAGTAAGLSYDLWLKETRWSWAPFIVAFAVLPPFVWSALDVFRTDLLALYAIALPLAPASHVANVLPDIATDAARGRRNLALIWGRGLSLRILGGCLLAPLALTLLSLPLIDYDREALALTVLVYAGLLGVTAACYARGLDRHAFRVVVVAAVLFAGGWLAAV